MADFLFALKNFSSVTLLTPPMGRFAGVKLGQEIQREHDLYSLHCVNNGMFKVIYCPLTFSHIFY